MDRMIRYDRTKFDAWCARYGLVIKVIPELPLTHDRDDLWMGRLFKIFSQTEPGKSISLTGCVRDGQERYHLWYTDSIHKIKSAQNLFAYLKGEKKFPLCGVTLEPWLDRDGSVIHWIHYDGFGVSRVMNSVLVDKDPVKESVLRAAWDGDMPEPVFRDWLMDQGYLKECA